MNQMPLKSFLVNIEDNEGFQLLLNSGLQKSKSVDNKDINSAEYIKTTIFHQYSTNCSLTTK